MGPDLLVSKLVTLLHPLEYKSGVQSMTYDASAPWNGGKGGVCYILPFAQEYGLSPSLMPPWILGSGLNRLLPEAVFQNELVSKRKGFGRATSPFGSVIAHKVPHLGIAL